MRYKSYDVELIYLLLNTQSTTSMHDLNGSSIRD